MSSFHSTFVKAVTESWTVFVLNERYLFDDVVEICDRLAKMGKMVVAAALLRDSGLESFDRNLHLLPKPEIIPKTAAVWHLLDPIEGSFL